MFKSVCFVALCLMVLVSAKPNLHHKNDSPLTSSLSTCDVQSIKDLTSQIVSLTSDTVDGIVASAVAAADDLAYCLWPLDLYMCLVGDREYDFMDNIKQIGVFLEDYAETLPPLLKRISDDVIACAAV